MGYTTFMIRSFAHCITCLEELPKKLAPQDFSLIECGLNFDTNFQVHCIRHDSVLLIFDMKNLPDGYINILKRVEENYE